ncbi:MAG: amino acid ABC transporter permease [Anaerolineales bacterium]|nr:amino acid ABC transporter permease [Anaerolineales bacterium]MCB8965689.1 amino acid ABC transporter permease [Ardenticatenaceae bacterium]
MAAVEKQANKQSADGSIWRELPWWLIAIIVFLITMGILIFVQEEFNRAFLFVKGELGSLEDFPDLVAMIGKGISVTIYTTLVAFTFSLLLGLLAGLGRISSNVILRNLAIFYVEFVRGVPTLVLIFTVAFVLVPWIAELIGGENSGVSMNSRAIIALAVIYGAFLAEIFRAGIESISRGQMEAARSLGMTHGQAMRYIILPQAIRNILPALGNDFIAMLKDSSLVSVLAVRDITQQARLYAGSTFRFRESYLILTFLYLGMTLTLSLLLRWFERRLGKNV